MRVLTDALKQMLDGLAHQDAGEFLTPSQKTAEFARGNRIRPEQQLVEPEPEPAVETRRRIALFMGSELAADVMDYIIQTCSRMQHDLTVLTFESEQVAQALLAPYNDSLDAAGIDTRVVSLGGNSVAQLARYLGNHSEIAFLACRESGYLGRSYVSGHSNRQEMPVPVVVIVERDKASAQPQDDKVAGIGNARAVRASGDLG